MSEVCLSVNSDNLSGRIGYPPAPQILLALCLKNLRVTFCKERHKIEESDIWPL